MRNWRSDKDRSLAELLEEYRQAEIETSRGEKYFAVRAEVIAFYLNLMSQGSLLFILLIPLALGGSYVPVWFPFGLFVFSRLADYLTTQSGLSLGAIELNPASEARRLKGFWSNFLFWGAVFGVLTLIAHFCSPLWVTRFVETKGGKWLYVAWIPVIAGFPILAYTLVSFTAAVNNIFVIFCQAVGGGSPTESDIDVAAIISLVFVAGLYALAAFLI